MFDVSARTVATQSLNIFGDHSDVMACRQTGFAMLVEQRAESHGSVPGRPSGSHRGKVPFLNFFDGFRTSHEYRRSRSGITYDLKEVMACNMEAVEFTKKALNPENPKMRGSHENGDVFFQHREACSSVYNALPAVVEKYMARSTQSWAPSYDLFNYCGAAVLTV